MTRRLTMLLCGAALLATAAFSADLGKFTNWPKSPEGYFMTQADRAAWKANVHSEADAEEFIRKFVASRGPGFAEEVAKRAGAADQHLSIAGRAGSLTTRGKIVILLGPPSKFTIAQKAAKGAYANGNPTTPGTAMSYGGSGSPGGGTSVQEVVAASEQAEMSTRTVTIYTFTYAADALPGKQTKAFVVEVVTDPGDGSDRIVDRRMAAQLDEMFEQAAQAQLAAAAANPPKS